MVRSWKRRYFRLSYGCLEYFEDYSSYEAHLKNGHASDARHSDLDSTAPFRPKGGITLCGAEVEVTEDRGEWGITVKGEGRTLEVKCQDRAQCVAWHTHLQLHIDLANEDCIAMEETGSNRGVERWVERMEGIGREGEDRLRKGVWMVKECQGVWGRKKHKRFFAVVDGELRWGPKEEGVMSGRSKKRVSLDEVTFVEGGTGGGGLSSGDLGDSSACGECGDRSCTVRVGLRKRTVEMEGETYDERAAWVADLYAVCYVRSLKRLRGAVEEARRKDKEREEGALHRAIVSSGR